MLNESKIRLMTKLTLSEEHQEKEGGKADSYYKADYIHLKVLTTIICVTVAFLLIFFLVACYHMEDLLEELGLDMYDGGTYARMSLYAE
mgnify:CR=1 FL=1